MGKPKAQVQPSIAELAEQLATMQRALAQLGQPSAEPPKRRSARGTPHTSRILELVSPSQVPQRPVDIADRIRSALVGSWEGRRGERLPMASEEIAKVTGDSNNAVSIALRKLKEEGRVVDLGSLGMPTLWTWRVGTTATDAERRSVVVGLIMTTPVGQRQIRELTGADPSKLDKDIVEIRRREPVWWMNKGKGGHGNFYWISPDRRAPPAELNGRYSEKRASRKK